MKFERLIIISTMAALSLLPYIEVGAEITEVSLSVDGLGCPFCVYGLEKKLKKVDGVKDLKIDLKSGIANITLQEGSIPNPSAFETAVKKAGFTPGELKITVIGYVVFKENNAFLKLRNSDWEYLLFVKGTETSNALLKDFEEKGALVAITGSIREKVDEPAGLSAEKVEEFATDS